MIRTLRTLLSTALVAGAMQVAATPPPAQEPSSPEAIKKALTGGGDALGRDGSKVDLKGADKDAGAAKKGKKSKLAPDPRPAPPPAEPGSGLNVVVVFDISNETVLKRSVGRTCRHLLVYAHQLDASTFWLFAAAGR